MCWLLPCRIWRRRRSQDAFAVTEDGRPQSIAQFTREPVPLTLAVALGASGSMAGKRFEYAREAVTIRRDEALVYSIGVDVPALRTTERVDAEALRRLTDQAGGATIVVRSDEAVLGAAERIGDELRQQYVIGFAPAHAGDGKFHKVQVTVTGCPKCRARARAGFVADKTASR